MPPTLSIDVRDQSFDKFLLDPFHHQPSDCLSAENGIGMNGKSQEGPSSLSFKLKDPATSRLPGLQFQPKYGSRTLSPRVRAGNRPRDRAPGAAA